MSFEAMAWASKLKTGSAGSKLVLLMLADHANGHTGQCNPKIKRIAEVCEMGESTVKTHIQKLADSGFLQIIPRFVDGVQIANQYMLNLDGVGQNLAPVGQNLAGCGSESGGGVGQNLATYKQEVLNQEFKPGIEPLFPAEQSPTEKPQKPAKEETALQAACRETWKSYGEAFFNRYGTEPVRNAKVSTAIKGFVQRVGHTEAPMIAAFYVGHNNAFYVRQCHDTGMLLKDSEKLRTEWATNTRVTNKAANEADRMQGQGDMYARLAAKIERGEL